MPCQPPSSALLTGWQRVLAGRAEDCAVHELASGRRYSFAEVDVMAANAQSALAAHGIVKADAVLLALGNGAAWLAHYLALTRLRAVIVPVEAGNDTQTTLSRNAGVAAAVRAKAAITAEGIFPIPFPHKLQPANVPSSAATCAKTASFPVGDSAPSTAAKAIAYQGKAAPCSADSVALPAGGAAAFEPHLIKLTSGTTGQPQALVFSEANMVADGRNIMATMGLHSGSINFATIPLGHSYGLGNLVMPFFLEGVAIAFGSGIVPRELGRELKESGATFFPTVPTILRMLAAAGLPKDTFEKTQCIISAGSPLAPAVAQAFFRAYGKAVSNFYGSSETGGICFDPDGRATQNGRGIGTAMANVSLKIADSGEVCVRSAAACPALYDAEGFVKLEDCGELLADGGLVLHGRSGRSVKIGARRLSLGAWEASVRALPGIEDVFACTVPRPNGEAMLCAALQTALSQEQTKQLLRDALPSWQQPRRLLTLATFPLSERGKPDAVRLREQLA